MAGQTWRLKYWIWSRWALLRTILSLMSSPTFVSLNQIPMNQMARKRLWRRFGGWRSQVELQSLLHGKVHVLLLQWRALTHILLTERNFSIALDNTAKRAHPHDKPFSWSPGPWDEREWLVNLLKESGFGDNVEVHLEDGKIEAGSLEELASNLMLFKDIFTRKSKHCQLFWGRNLGSSIPSKRPKVMYRLRWLPGWVRPGNRRSGSR